MCGSVLSGTAGQWQPPGPQAAPRSHAGVRLSTLPCQGIWEAQDIMVGVSGHDPMVRDGASRALRESGVPNDV